MEYQGSLAGESTATGTRVMLGVQVPVTSVCPCSKAISDYGAHNQRTTITIWVNPRHEDGMPVAHLGGGTYRGGRDGCLMSGVPSAEAA